MGIDEKNPDLEVAGVSAGDADAKDVINGSIADGDWIVRIVGIADSKGVSGSGKKDKRALVLYVPQSDPKADATPVLIKQNQIARWIPAFTRAESAKAAIDNGTKWKITLTTAKEDVTIGEYTFKPQNATNVAEV